MASHGVWYAVVGIVIIAVIGGAYYYSTLPGPSPSPSPSPSLTPSPSPSPIPSPSPGPSPGSLNITIYGGEVSTTKLGWGLSPDDLSSPGPTLNLTIGQTVTVTFYNVGQYPHAWAITLQNSSDSQQAFSNAHVGSATIPILAGGHGTTTFVPDKTGSFFYVCPVPGHSDLGMWGRVQVASAP